MYDTSTACPGVCVLLVELLSNRRRIGHALLVNHEFRYVCSSSNSDNNKIIIPIRFSDKIYTCMLSNRLQPLVLAIITLLLLGCTFLFATEKNKLYLYFTLLR